MLSDAVLRGLAVYALVAIIRALPWVEGKFYRGWKPWACDICMTFWTTVGIVAFQLAFAIDSVGLAPGLRAMIPEVILPALGGQGLAILMLRFRNEIPPGAVP